MTAEVAHVLGCFDTSMKLRLDGRPVLGWRCFADANLFHNLC